MSLEEGLRVLREPRLRIEEENLAVGIVLDRVMEGVRALQARKCEHAKIAVEVIAEAVR